MDKISAKLDGPATMPLRREDMQNPSHRQGNVVRRLRRESDHLALVAFQNLLAHDFECWIECQLVSGHCNQSQISGPKPANFCAKVGIALMFDRQLCAHSSDTLQRVARTRLIDLGR